MVKGRHWSGVEMGESFMATTSGTVAKIAQGTRVKACSEKDCPCAGEKKFPEKVAHTSRT